jgi:hypothetical protein
MLVVLLVISLLSVNGFAYGPRGHKLVGAIADKRLAKNPAVAQKVRDMLDGMTLAVAANLPDDIKDAKIWKCGGALTGNRIHRELQAFLNANCEQGDPFHKNFHFTDVPVFKPETYGAGSVGRKEFDIVHLIPLCISVLKGDEPEANDRKITKSVAIILLAHYIGDIHQPLHVGAEFFNNQRLPFQPPNEKVAFSDVGGNNLTLNLFVKKELTPVMALHGYWDGQTVTDAFRNQTDNQVVAELSSQEPENWKLNGDPDTWAEQMADEILPLAREAHTRLRFDHIVLNKKKRIVATGDAFEKTHGPGGTFYAPWAAQVVRQEIHKGGWRLAALLEAVVQ